MIEVTGGKKNDIGELFNEYCDLNNSCLSITDVKNE
jgi:hypothetical protein